MRTLFIGEVFVGEGLPSVAWGVRCCVVTLRTTCTPFDFPNQDPRVFWHSLPVVIQMDCPEHSHRISPSLFSLHTLHLLQQRVPQLDVVGAIVVVRVVKLSMRPSLCREREGHVLEKLVLVENVLLRCWPAQRARRQPGSNPQQALN